MKKLLAMFMVVVMGIGLFGCAPQTATPPAADPTPGATAPATAPTDGAAQPAPAETSLINDETLHCGLTAVPTSLDEGYSTNTHCRVVSAHIFETLFTFDDGGAVIPQLAEGYTVSDDGLIYNITLREGIAFHDGSAFEAEDVIASIERYKTNSTYTSALDGVMLEKVNDFEVKFTLENPLALTSLLAFPQRVLITPSEIASAHMGTELMDAALIGTGPYMLREWVRDVKIVLDRFDGYVSDTRYEEATGLGGNRTPYFKTIELATVTEAEGRLAGLETGELDYAESLPATSFDRISDNPELTVNILCPDRSICVEMNHSEGFTTDLNFRKALVYAVNPEQVLQAITTGKKEFYRLDPSLYQPEQYFYTEAGSAGIYNSQDLEKVKELLAAANYNGEQIIYLTNRDFDYMYAASMSLIEQWNAAGINVVPEFNDWTSQIAKAQSLTGWSINQTSYSARFDPNQVRNMLHSKTMGAYGFADAQIDALLEKIGEGGTNEERYVIWEQIQQRIWEQLPFIKFGDYLSMDAIRSDLVGYKPFNVSRFWTVHK